MLGDQLFDEDDERRVSPQRDGDSACGVDHRYIVVCVCVVEKWIPEKRRGATDLSV